MYLHEITIRNYSIHQSTKVTLHPISVFVGPNGSGKSALFDALINFSMLARGKISEAFGPYPYSFAATRHRSAHQVERIAYDVIMADDQTSQEKVLYSVDYSQVGQASESEFHPRFEIYKETLDLNGKNLFNRDNLNKSKLGGALTQYLSGDIGILSAIRRAESEGQATDVPNLVREVAKEVSRLNKFRLEPNNLRLPSALPDVTVREGSRIGHAGENIASTLYFLEQTKSPAMVEIVSRLRKALPDFDGFEFNTVGAQRIGFSIRFTDVREAIPAPRLSDGQLLVVGMMVLLYSPARPPIVMIEEPENGLTSTVQREVYSAIRDLAFGTRSNRSQVLISSHSPFVLCDAWNGEDREFVHQVKVENGRAVVRAFSQAVDAQGIQLAKDADGKRTKLNLRNAEELMAGYLA